MSAVFRVKDTSFDEIGSLMIGIDENKPCPQNEIA
jgi:ribosomal protein L5